MPGGAVEKAFPPIRAREGLLGQQPDDLGRRPAVTPLPVCLLKTPEGRAGVEICVSSHTVIGMIALLSFFGSLLSFRVRSRTSLELELVPLRHHVTVLRRQRPGQPRLFSADRLLWVWLYRIWPQVLNTMVLVKPATVVQCHRKGFRLYWRRRSLHLGPPEMSRAAV